MKDSLISAAPNNTTISELQRYQYQSLSPNGLNIRLISLELNENFDAPLSCSIFEVSLSDDDCPSYGALSYVWGDPQPVSDIIIKGSNCISRLGLAQNLESALRHLRNGHAQTVFWIAALCF